MDMKTVSVNHTCCKLTSSVHGLRTPEPSQIVCCTATYFPVLAMHNPELDTFGSCMWRNVEEELETSLRCTSAPVQVTRVFGA